MVKAKSRVAHFKGLKRRIAVSYVFELSNLGFWIWLTTATLTTCVA